jgi:hypothetical protein
VFSTSKEWENVEVRFKATMPSANILKIERIQNRKLWKVFKNEVEDVEIKNNGDANIQSLFHGTRETPPQTVFTSEEGFNINYSNEGMWGKANYFAYDSKYSDLYATVLPDGLRQMLMAKVIIGKTIEMQPTKTLRTPPIIEGSKEVPYDSVKGNTKGTDVIMVYSNKKAYPEYLITY